MGKKHMVSFFFFFTFGTPEKKYLLKQGQPTPRITNRVVVRAMRQHSATEPGYSQHSSAMLCSWSRCDLPLRRVPVLPLPSACSCIHCGWDPAARWDELSSDSSSNPLVLGHPHQQHRGTAAMPCSPHQAELNSCLKLTFQESIWMKVCFYPYPHIRPISWSLQPLELSSATQDHSEPKVAQLSHGNSML